MPYIDGYTAATRHGLPTTRYGRVLQRKGAGVTGVAEDLPISCAGAATRGEGAAIRPTGPMHTIGDRRTPKAASFLVPNVSLTGSVSLPSTGSQRGSATNILSVQTRRHC